MDTGSPWTFMTKETFTALGIDVASKDSYFNINVHGTPLTVYPSVNHFEDINVCGQSFFVEHVLKVEVDYNKRKVVMVQTPTMLSYKEMGEL